MRFSAPCNWQPDLIYQVDKRFVDELYGKLPVDFVGGGRSAFLMPHVSKRKVALYVSEIHKQGLKFNYLLNSYCMGNKELTASGQRKLFRFLEWLAEIKADSVTVSIPYLLELVKNNFPTIKAGVSVIAGVDSIERAKYWQELGADRITLSYFGLNRDFSLLKQMRKSLKCELQLIANLECLYSCPFYNYHSAVNAHSSQPQTNMGGFIVDYCSVKCRYIRISDPSKFISACWIRPEDTHYYEDVGIDRLKFVDRGMTTADICRIIKAYSDRKYDGNLLDLFCNPSKRIVFHGFGLLSKIRYFLHPFSINIFRLYKAKKLLTEDKIYIDNAKLDGFIKYFFDKRCALTLCQNCGYCQEIALKAVKIDPGYQQEKIKKYYKFLDEIVSGAMFRYFE